MDDYDEGKPRWEPTRRVAAEPWPGFTEQALADIAENEAIQRYHAMRRMDLLS